MSSGMVDLSGVSHFSALNLGSGDNNVTVTDTTLSGGVLAIAAGPSGSNIIDASADTAASTNSRLAYFAGPGTDTFIGGHESDTVYVAAANVGGDTLTGGSGSYPNLLALTTSGSADLGGGPLLPGYRLYGFRRQPCDPHR